MEHTKANILSLQKDLRVIHDADADIPLVNPDGIYDEQTQTAVKAFQQKFGLPVTGEVDYATFALMQITADAIRKENAAPERITVFEQGQLPLAQGHYSGEVYLLQALINALALRHSNLKKVDVTGEYDLKTAEQIRNLQDILGLPQTGVLDKALWDKIALIWK